MDISKNHRHDIGRSLILDTNSFGLRPLDSCVSTSSYKTKRWQYMEPDESKIIQMNLFNKIYRIPLCTRMWVESGGRSLMKPSYQHWLDVVLFTTSSSSWIEFVSTTPSALEISWCILPSLSLSSDDVIEVCESLRLFVVVLFDLILSPSEGVEDGVAEEEGVKENNDGGIILAFVDGFGSLDRSLVALSVGLNAMVPFRTLYWFECTIGYKWPACCGARMISGPMVIVPRFQWMNSK